MIKVSHIVIHSNPPARIEFKEEKHYKDLQEIDNLKQTLKEWLGFDVTWGHCDYDYLKNREKK